MYRGNVFVFTGKRYVCKANINSFGEKSASELVKKGYAKFENTSIYKSLSLTEIGKSTVIDLFPQIKERQEYLRNQSHFLGEEKT